MDQPADNAEVVAKAFELFAQGDISLFSPDYTHLGYNIDGRPMVFEGLAAFLGMMAQIPGTFEVFENDIVSTQIAANSSSRRCTCVAAPTTAKSSTANSP